MNNLSDATLKIAKMAARNILLKLLTTESSNSKLFLGSKNPPMKMCENRSRNMKLEYIVVYENSWNVFDI